MTSACAVPALFVGVEHALLACQEMVLKRGGVDRVQVCSCGGNVLGELFTLLRLMLICYGAVF